MKFRIPIHSRHASVISDFFRQTANYFDCLSTTPVSPVQQTPPEVKTEETNQAESAKEPERSAVSRTQIQTSIDEISKNNKSTILVIDDDRSILRLIKSAAGGNYNVTTMLNGDLLNKFFENRTVDLILLDYEMPGENGPDIFRRLRAMPNVQDTPIVFLTGVSDRKKIQEVLSLKPQGYVLKPINMDKLFSTIYGLLG